MRKWIILLILILNISLIHAEEVRFIKTHYSESFKDLYTDKIKNTIREFSNKYNISTEKLKIEVYPFNKDACGYTILGSKKIMISSDIDCLLDIRDILVHELQHYRWAQIDKRAYYFDICKGNDIALRNCYENFAYCESEHYFNHTNIEWLAVAGGLYYCGH